jgi:hypothetical protein
MTIAHAVSNYAQHDQNALDFFNQNNHKNTNDFFVLLQRETPDDLRNSVGQDQQVAFWNSFKNDFLREVQVNRAGLHRAGLHIGDLRVAWGQLSQQAKERIWKACRIAISMLPVSMLNASVLLALLNGEQSVQDMSLGSIIIPHVIVDTVLYKFVSDKVLSWLSRKIGFQR